MRKLGLILIFVLAFVAFAFAADPVYQDIPTDSSQIMASGIADASGVGGVAFIEYWVWDGGNGYYYYTYRIHNSAFSPYIKHLTIGNPTSSPYIVTGSSSGWNPIDNTPGTVPWNYSIHETMPTLVDWVSTDPYSNVYPGYSSWAPENGPLFQFASPLPPAIAGFTVRQGDLMVYAAGLIASPGNSLVAPRSAGYWKHQSGTKGKRTEAAHMPDYLFVINSTSTVFENLTVSSGYDILQPNNSSDMIAKAKRQLLALWYNVVSGKLNYAASVQVEDSTGTIVEVVISQVIADIEAAILDPATPADQLEYLKDLVEILNLM